MYRVRRLGVVKTTNTVVGMYVVVFGVIGLLVALFASVAYVSTSSGGTTFVWPSAIAALLVAFLFYFVFIWIGVALACVVYNLVAGRTGGIEIELTRVEPPVPVPTWGQPGTPRPTTWADQGPAAGWTPPAGPSNRDGGPAPWQSGPVS